MEFSMEGENVKQRNPAQKESYLRCKVFRLFIFGLAWDSQENEPDTPGEKVFSDLEV